MTAPKILFLDFDGVLNANTENLEPDKVALLNQVVDAVPDLVVVVTSSWRIIYKLVELREYLGDAGYRGKVHGKTPNLGCKDHIKAGYLECSQAHRGSEISAFLLEYADRHDEEDEPVYVILDDSADMGPLLDKLVRTYGYRGLEQEHVDEVIKRLGGRHEATASATA